MYKFKDSYSKSVILNYIFKFLSMLLGMLSLRITIEYLGSYYYGLWVTLSSIVSWMASGDMGLGNGLRNESAKAYSNGQRELQNAYIKQAITMLSRKVVVIMAFLVAVSELFFVSGILDPVVRLPLYITLLFFSVNLILGMSQSVAHSIQKSWICSVANCGTVVLFVLLIFLLDILRIESSLVYLAIVHGVSITCSNVALILYLRRNGLWVFKDASGETESERKAPEVLKKNIMSAGLQFFGLQICAIILFSTDSVIINYLFDGTKVTEYSIISKVYDTGYDMFLVLLISLWSAVTFHMERGEYDWVTKKIKTLILLWGFFTVGVLVVSLNLNWLIDIWLGKSAIAYDGRMIILFGGYCVASTFTSIFVHTLNGLGKIKLQLTLAIIESVVNIPLSVFLAKNCSMGIFGVKLATFVCVAWGVVIMPLQTMFVMRKYREGQGGDAG